MRTCENINENLPIIPHQPIMPHPPPISMCTHFNDTYVNVDAIFVCCLRSIRSKNIGAACSHKVMHGSLEAMQKKTHSALLNFIVQSDKESGRMPTVYVLTLEKYTLQSDSS